MKLYNILCSALFISFLTFGAKAQESDQVQYSYEQLSGSDMTEAKLKEALKQNPEDLKANYNLAIHYYNQGVQILEDMDYNGTFEEQKKVQDGVIASFKTALPMALKAFELDSKNKATISMLSGIYFGLNQIDESKHYEAMLLKM